MGDSQTGAQQRSDELALVARCRRGEPAAKSELLRGLLPTMRGAIRALLGARPEVDDAVQQAAIDILRGLPTYRGDAPLRAWARTIAVRAGLKITRSSTRHLSAVDPETLHAAPREAGAAERIAKPLAAYLDGLPAAQREALVLRHALEFTVPEIAELLGTSVNTIKSRLLSARKEVRKLIRRDEAVASFRKGGTP
ncbi:MAG: RNA polymerase sigma factor [Myxococcota bacterium]